MIKFYCSYTYNGNYAITPIFEAFSLSEIHEQAKHISKVLEVSVTIILIHGDYEIASLPL